MHLVPTVESMFIAPTAIQNRKYFARLVLFQFAGVLRFFRVLTAIPSASFIVALSNARMQRTFYRDHIP